MSEKLFYIAFLIDGWSSSTEEEEDIYMDFKMERVKANATVT
jgi:hypothetical protein